MNKPTKFVFILRSLPGTGDDVITNLLALIAKDPVIISANSFFMKDGKFHFDKTLLKEAHKHSWESFKTAIESDSPFIIVNNSNIKRYHYAHYVDYAQRHDYHVSVVIIPFNHLTNKELSLDNTQGVDQNAIRKMRNSFEWEF